LKSGIDDGKLLLLATTGEKRSPLTPGFEYALTCRFPVSHRSLAAGSRCV